MSKAEELIRRYEVARKKTVLLKDSRIKYLRDNVRETAFQEMHEIRTEALSAWSDEFSKRRDVWDIIKAFREHPDWYFGKSFRVLETELSNKSVSFPFSPPLTSVLTQKVMRDVLIQVLNQSVPEGTTIRTEDGFLYKENEVEAARRRRAEEAARELALEKKYEDMEVLFAGRDDVDSALRYLKKNPYGYYGCCEKHLYCYGSPCQTVVSFEPPLKDGAELDVMLRVLQHLIRLHITSGQVPEINRFPDLAIDGLYKAIVTNVFSSLYTFKLYQPELEASIIFSNPKYAAESVSVGDEILVRFVGYNSVGSLQFKNHVYCSTGWKDYPVE